MTKIIAQISSVIIWKEKKYCIISKSIIKCLFKYFFVIKEKGKNITKNTIKQNNKIGNINQ